MNEYVLRKTMTLLLSGQIPTPLLITLTFVGERMQIIPSSVI